MDTSDEASGANVTPVIYNNYDGGDIALKNNQVMSTKMFPFLRKLAGQTLITSDGNTLLGADDKAGIAEIITAIGELIESGEPHGEIWVGFTPDEEIGEGSDFFDLDYFKAKYAYTVDGEEVNVVECENFNAATAVVTISGVAAHPGSAKGVMINSQYIGGKFMSRIPIEERPETTEGDEGFYHLTDMKGSVSETVLTYILRDFCRDGLEHRKKTVCEIANQINREIGSEMVTVEIEDSYYNMYDKIKDHRHLIDIANQAIIDNGMTIDGVSGKIRGGTDGARLSYMGLPCPNLGTGGHNFHSCYECITVEDMDRAVGVIKRIIGLYAEGRGENNEDNNC